MKWLETVKNVILTFIAVVICVGVLAGGFATSLILTGLIVIIAITCIMYAIVSNKDDDS